MSAEIYDIEPDWPEFEEHPEWILRDEAGRRLYIRYGCDGTSCPQFAAEGGGGEPTKGQEDVESGGGREIARVPGRRHGGIIGERYR